MSKSNLPAAGLDQLQRAALPSAGNQAEPGTGIISLGPDGVLRMRLLMIRSGLLMEAGIARDGSPAPKMRMTRKAASCLTIAKREFGIVARTAKAAVPLFENLLVTYGVIQASERTPGT